MKNVSAQLDQAVALHGAGRYRDAEARYRKILAAQPRNASARHLLGCLHLHTGNVDAGIRELRRATELDPSFADAFTILGAALLSRQRWEEAATVLERAVELDPEFTTVRINFGVALQNSDRADEAEKIYRRVLAAEPDNAEARSNLSFVLHALKRYAEAEDEARAALAIAPTHAEAQNNLAMALAGLERYDEAEIHCRRAIELDPNLAQAHLGLFNVMRARKRFTEAERSARRVADLWPHLLIAHDSVGLGLLDLDRPAEAEASFRKALTCGAKHAAVYQHLAASLRSQARFDEAVAAGRKAVELEDSDETRFNLALDLLVTGRYSEGWRGYEGRTFLTRGRPELDGPIWTGGPLNGRRLLIHAEQGFGDTIQFARYLPRAAERANGHVTFECQRELAEALRGVPGFDAIEPRAEAATPPSFAFDVRISLASLPFALKLSDDDIPTGRLPLVVPSERTAYWRERFADRPGLRVGLRWAGNPGHGNDRNRSMRFADLAPLAEVANVTLISLQTDEPARQLAERGANERIEDVSGRLTNFQETAALISTLDLVITVDTAVAHIAGALGVETWLLLPLAPDWRWDVRCPDSTRWYERMRLFRQPVTKDWETTVTRIAFELSGRVTDRGDASSNRAATSAAE